MCSGANVLPQVCVIGAGCSGLTVVKALRESGIPHVCFEMSDRVGGNWVFGNKNGRSGAYRSLHINTSRRRMEFSDFPMPESLPDFPHHRHVSEYFEKYARHFGLHESIRFEQEVLRCQPLPDVSSPDGAGWAVTTRDLRTGQTEEHTFSSLVVAHGHHWDPALPDPPLPGSFDGKVIHSHAYVDPTNPLDFRGKRVVVVGMGNSAMDIAAELCRPSVAERLYLSGRRGAWIIPKYIRGKPLDEKSIIPHWIPEPLRRRLITRAFVLLHGRMSDYGLPEPDHLLGEAHPTVSNEVPALVGSGAILPKPAIERLCGTEVQFSDGSREQVDAIVYCTGYRITFPFFDADILSAPDNALRLFLRMFEPRFRKLCLIGFAQPHGAIMPIVEQQSLLLAAFLQGEYVLPSIQEMERSIHQDQRWLKERFVASRRHTIQIDPERYLAALARERLQGGKRAFKPISA